MSPDFIHILIHRFCGKLLSHQQGALIFLCVNQIHCISGVTPRVDAATGGTRGAHKSPKAIDKRGITAPGDPASTEQR
jgi:hypothetical protein